MRVLFVNACGRREGDVNHALLVLAHLPPEIRVSIASLPRGAVYDALRALPNREGVLRTEMGGSELPAPSRRLGPLSEAAEFACALAKIVGFARRERSEVICCIDRTVGAYLAAFAARLLRRPLVLIAAYPFYGRDRAINRFVLRSATRIVSHSAYLTGHLRQVVRAESRIATIPDPVDIARFRPDPAARAAQRDAWEVPEGGCKQNEKAPLPPNSGGFRRAFGAGFEFRTPQNWGAGGPEPEGATIILLAGRVNQYKGHDDLVRAASVVLRSHPETYVFFCGGEDESLLTWGDRTDSYKGHVERLSAELGITERVRFLGYVPDLAAVMDAADIVAMPSHEEPYGLVALEAMALGKPVVATDAGGVPEFVREGETGLLVPPRQPAALADALLRLIGDPDAARAMGERARARVEAEFDVARYIARFVPVLHAAAKTTSEGAARRLRITKPLL